MPTGLKIPTAPDVFEHTVEVVRHLEVHQAEGFSPLGRVAQPLAEHLEQSGSGGSSRMALLKLAALCHDLGKPQTRQLHSTGRVRFPAHERIGAAIAREIAQRLGLATELAERLALLVECHTTPVAIPSRPGPPSRIHRLFRAAGDLLPELVLLSLVDLEAARGPASSDHRRQDQRAFVTEMLEEYFQQGFLCCPTVPVSTVDLEQELGVTEKSVRRQLTELLTEAYIDGEFEGREDGLGWAFERLEYPLDL